MEIVAEVGDIVTAIDGSWVERVIGNECEEIHGIELIPMGEMKVISTDVTYPDPARSYSDVSDSDHVSFLIKYDYPLIRDVLLLASDGSVIITRNHLTWIRKVR